MRVNINPTLIEGDDHIVRGGGFNLMDRLIKSTLRSYNWSDIAVFTNGLRVVAVPTIQPTFSQGDTMNEQTFLATLHDNPNDEVTWLALADWLEEDGQSQRAELVRLTAKLVFRPAPLLDEADRQKRKAAEKRVQQLLDSGVQPLVPTRTNSIGMQFALIPTPGLFFMGEGDKQRTVLLTEQYYMGVHQVTQAQWQEVMGINPSAFTRGGSRAEDVEDVSDEDLTRFPVERVSWDEAQEFCKRLTEREFPDGGWQYRLPTEAEWEYACRGGTTSAYHYGDSIKPGQANFMSSDESLNHRRPCPVGAYVPNAFGLYDMHGNVWEWCQDAYSNTNDHPTVDASNILDQIMPGWQKAVWE